MYTATTLPRLRGSDMGPISFQLFEHLILLHVQKRSSWQKCYALVLFEVMQGVQVTEIHFGSQDQMLPFWKTTFHISKNLRYTFTYSMCAYKTSREKDMVCDLCEKSQFSVPQNDFSQAIFVFFFCLQHYICFFFKRCFRTRIRHKHVHFSKKN
jgi:hypothetical protein